MRDPRRLVGYGLLALWAAPVLVQFLGEGAHWTYAIARGLLPPLFAVLLLVSSWEAQDSAPSS